MERGREPRVEEHKHISKRAMILFQMVLGMIFKTARQTLRFFQKQLYLLSQSQIAYENLSLQLETPLKK